MKKTKFMIGALVLSMGLLGTGYAYWTDTVTATGTVSTGNLKVGFTGVSAVGAPQRQDKAGHLGLKPGPTAGISNEQLTKTTVDASFTKDGRSAKFTLTDLCPGYKATYTAKIQNAGTMAALLESIDVDPSGLGDLSGHIGLRVKVTNNSNWNWIDGKETNHSIVIGKEHYMPIEEASIIINNWINNNIHAQVQDASLYVNPEDAMEIELEVAMVTNPAGDDNATQNLKNGTFSVTTNWTQYNKGIDNSGN